MLLLITKPSDYFVITLGEHGELHTFTLMFPDITCSRAENVQTNVVVLWLEKLASELQDRGQTQEAANCVRKAMHYFGAEKGETLAQVRMLWLGLICRALLR